MASDSNLYLPSVVFPEPQVACLWCTPVSVFTDRPAFFVGDISGFAGPEDAGLLGAGVVEGEDVGVGLAGLGAPTA